MLWVIIFSRFLRRYWLHDLAAFIGNYLSPFHFGFVPGRRIHTCITLAFEAINCMEQSTVANMAIKVDITKAFDSISWIFLKGVLARMGLSSRFQHMVESILKFAHL